MEAGDLLRTEVKARCAWPRGTLQFFVCLGEARVGGRPALLRVPRREHRPPHLRPPAARAAGWPAPPTAAAIGAWGFSRSSVQEVMF
jgi:hypothetical protein